MVTPTRPNIMLYVHCLSCFWLVTYVIHPCKRSKFWGKKN